EDDDGIFGLRVADFWLVNPQSAIRNPQSAIILEARRQRSCQVAPKPLPIAEHPIRLDPRRRRAESHRCEQFDHVSDRQFVEAIDHGSPVGPRRARVKPVAERAASNRALAAARRTHDESDLPILIAPRHIDSKPFLRALAEREPEYPSHLLDTKRIANRTTDS